MGWFPRVFLAFGLFLAQMAHASAPGIIQASIPGAAQVSASAEVTLYFIPSPKGIDWATPSLLAKSTLANQAPYGKHPLKHSIGHVNVEVACGDRVQDRILAGMTSADKSDRIWLLLKDRIGLGVLFHDFEGKLQETSEIEEDIASRMPTGDISWLTIKINQGSCQRLLQYYSEYRERGYDKHYGLHLRPRYGEGAGCSAFGASFLELAGVLDQEFVEGWQLTRLVPEGLIGSEIRRVSLWELIWSRKAKRWAEPDEPHRRIDFWDPDVMHQWALRTWKQESISPSGKYLLQKNGKSYGLLVDRVDVPTPADPIWKSDSHL